VFGFSFSELVVLVIVALIVIGPKDLPKVLRKLGQWAGRLRRMAADLRAQSGIDEVLKADGLGENINEIRKLARGELDDIRRASDLTERTEPARIVTDPLEDLVVERQREYPLEGADAYQALPDTAMVYTDTFPKSPYARDPLYMLGDPDAKMPEEPEPRAEADAAAPDPEATPESPPANTDDPAAAPPAPPAGEPTP
jgi:sec-independent protein translocase protein TatB